MGKRRWDGGEAARPAALFAPCGSHLSPGLVLLGGPPGSLLARHQLGGCRLVGFLKARSGPLEAGDTGHRRDLGTRASPEALASGRAPSSSPGPAEE